MPGSVITLNRGGCSVDHTDVRDQEEAFSDKKAYLQRYQVRQRPRFEAARSALPLGQVDVAEELRQWFEPLLDRADVMSAGIGGVVVIDYGSDRPEGVAIDFNRRRVEPLEDQQWMHYLKIDRPLLEYCIVHQLEDWVNELFLSFRFRAKRKGPYNEYVYTFFKCLSMERLQYAEGYYAERSSADQFWEAAGYRIQRRCPHLKADLTKFGRIEGGVLTCTMHGWQYDLATGRSLTSEGTTLYCRPLSAISPESDASVSQP